MGEALKEFPYLQSLRTLTDLPKALRKSMPPTIDVHYIQIACKVAEGTAKNILLDLKNFNFIDENNVLTERGRLLRNPERYPEVGREILEEFYPTVLTMLEMYPDEWEETLDNFLSEKTNLGDSARSKVRATVALLWGMAQGLSPEQAANSRRNKKEKATTDREAKSKRVKVGFDTLSQATGQHVAPESGSNATIPIAEEHRLDTISSVLRINIDGTWDPERINLIFDRLERLVGLEKP
ncbi:DUF5343 domain-containing protein [Moorellaceae bacterium AZ2]